MGRIGASELAGHTLALQIAALAFQVPFGVGQAATIRVGYHFGARRPRGDRPRRAGSASRWAPASWCLTAALMLLAPALMLRIYVDPDAPGQRGDGRLRGPVTWSWRRRSSCSTESRRSPPARCAGCRTPACRWCIAIFGYWVPGTGLPIWLGFFTPLEGTGVWIGLATGLVVVAGLLTARWARREPARAACPRLKRKKFAADGVDARCSAHYMRAAGTLHGRVPIASSTNWKRSHNGIPSAARPRSGPPHRGRGKDRRRHHHPRQRQGKAERRRDRRRRHRRPQRAGQGHTRSTSRPATASCSASGPAPRSSSMAKTC